MIAALLLAQAAAGAGPTAAEIEAALPPGQMACIDGRDRTGRFMAICPILSPHVQTMACREDADLGGHVCDYSLIYADYHHQIGGNAFELRSELFARNTGNPTGWRIVRELAPPRTQQR
jgi:hypothetical protein